MPFILILLGVLAGYLTFAEPWVEPEIGYTHSEFDVLNESADRHHPIHSNATDRVHVRSTRMRSRQAAALKDVWQLNDADITKEVRLWE